MTRAFIALWWALGIALLVLSAQSVWPSIQPGHGGIDLHAVVLGSIEAVAAVLFLVPRAMRFGGVTLLLVFGIVFVLHLLRGHLAAPLVVYAAGVVFVLVHGPVSRGDARARA